jgi:hypothetical protein
MGPVGSCSVRLGFVVSCSGSCPVWLVAQSGPAPPAQVRRWSSHYVRVEDDLFGSGPQGLSSDPGPSRVGPVGSRFVRLETFRITVLLRLRPDLASSSVRVHVRRVQVLSVWCASSK